MSNGFVSVDSLTNVTQTAQQANGSNKTSLGKQDFLALLTKQMSSQNPLDPLKNEDFVAQLAQFSNLEQLQMVNSNIQSQSHMLNSLNNGIATSLIGKTVKVEDLETIKPGEKIMINPKKTAEVTVKIKDSEGNVVKEDSLGLVNGERKWKLDEDLTEGKYSYEIDVKNLNEEPVEYSSAILAKVEGVEFDSKGTTLKVGERSLSISEITEVYE